MTRCSRQLTLTRTKSSEDWPAPRSGTGNVRVSRLGAAQRSGDDLRLARVLRAKTLAGPRTCQRLGLDEPRSWGTRTPPSSTALGKCGILKAKASSCQGLSMLG